MLSPFSFRSVPNNILDCIKNHTIINLYSKFSFFYISIQKYNEQERENNQKSIINLLFCSLKDFKFITLYLNELSFNNNLNIKTPNNNNNNPELEKKSIVTDINAFFCTEEKLIIIQQINIQLIKTLISKLQDKKVTILNTGPEFEIYVNSANENNLEEEINNFCLKFKSEINQNDFVKATIAPIAGYIIRRFFYPSHYFKDSSFFFLFDEYKTKEENMKTKLYKLIFRCPNIVQFVYQFNQIIQEMKSEIMNDEKVNNTTEFKFEDFIKLRSIYTNQSSNYYLVIHLKSFHIFMMKELKKSNESKREIDFVENFSHRCFTQFYGFIKERKSIKAIIYEYMCNGTLKQYINKTDSTFSLLTIIRLFEGLEYLYSKSLIHRDLKPSNILLDHDFLPYISDFETIRDPGTDEPMTNDLGSISYSSPEQYEGGYLSFHTDIYSFGLIVYFLYEKKDFYNNNSYDKTSNHLYIEFSPESKTSENIRKLFIKCIEFSQEKRPTNSEIKSSIIQEIYAINFLDLSKETNKKIELIRLIYENILIQHDNKEELYNWIFEMLKICFNLPKLKYHNFDSIQDTSKQLLNLGYRYFLGHSVERNFKKAKEYFELSAKQNNSDAFFYLGALYAEGLGVEQNYLKAKEYFELSAKQNNSTSLLNLGTLYKDGLGVERNYNKAKEYFELSAKQNNSIAINNLGILYENGQGVERNYKKAKEYYELSAKQNNSDAFLCLGNLYSEGLGVEKNYKKAKEYYEISAKHKNSMALYNLGNYYYQGLGVEQNYKKAKEYYELSARQNNSNAFLNLGLLYAEGQGVERNYKKAKEYFELSIQQNGPIAFLNLGNLYYHGLGVEQNYTKAREYYELSAKHNNSSAFLNLGNIYYKGQGVKQNYEKAKEYFELSAKLNNSDAFLYLGNIYYLGQDVEQNYKKAKKFFELSSQQNNPIAFLNLGILYLEGQGVEQNYEKAKEYFELSAKLNNSDSFIYLGNLYLNGKGVEQNYKKAKKYFELSSQQNSPTAFLELGNLYLNGKGVERNYKKAKEYYELSAKQNNSYALYHLGKLYSEGLGVKQNYKKAKEYYELSAKYNNSEALFILGNLYSKGLGVEQNYKKAKEYYEILWKQNNSDALISLGNIYENGLGVPKDICRAKYYYELSAKQNNSYAYIRLAHFYMKEKTVFDNFSTIKNLLEKAAQLKNPIAFLELGDIYFRGIFIEPNYEKAMENYQKAANSNVSQAYLNLGKMYLLGIGIEQDLKKGKKYFEYSAQLNNSEALFTLGLFYLVGEIVDIDISKSIQYLNKCKENKITEHTLHILNPYEVIICYLEENYNYLYYRSMNDLGLIYLTVFDDIEKATDNIKESAFGEYPFGQNNYGLLYQFYLNNLENAEYFFKRSSKHQFALSEYNLGYMKEQEGKTEESIKYYIQASEHEYVPLEFQRLIHLDIRLNISKIFIIFYTNIKLMVYYYKDLKFEECKKYFIKAFSKFIDLKNNFIQNNFQKIKETKGNLFSFLKFLIFFYPKFNFINQPNLISKEKLNEIASQANILLIIYEEQKEIRLYKEHKNIV